MHVSKATPLFSFFLGGGTRKAIMGDLSSLHIYITLGLYVIRLLAMHFMYKHSMRSAVSAYGDLSTYIQEKHLFIIIIIGACMLLVNKP